MLKRAAVAAPALQRRRRKKAVADLNVLAYIKQQQSRGSSRKWQQEWWV
jgi:hypothetical protein